jgi:hypothetical protein
VQQKLDDKKREESSISKIKKALEELSDIGSGSEDEEDQAELRRLIRERRSAE